MKKKTNYALYIIFAVLLCFVIILFVFNRKNVDNKNSLDNNSNINQIQGNENINNNGNVTNRVNSREISLTDVESYKIYFKVNGMINNFCEGLNSSDKDLVFNTLDKNYINNHSITKENVLDNFSNFNDFPSFLINSLKKVNGVDKSIYFASGYLSNYDFEGELLYKEYVNFLVTVSGTYYNLYLIDNSDINAFLKSYNYDNNIVDKEYNKYKVSSFKEKDLLDYYLLYYKYLLLYYPNTAFDMLSTSCKQKYIDYNAFVEDAYTIYDFINLNYLGYSINEKVSPITYKVELRDGGKITIKENKIMDFTIDFIK